MNFIKKFTRVKEGTRLRRESKLGEARKRKICGSLKYLLKVFMFASFLGTLALAQSGTASGPQADRMPLLMPDDFSALHLLAWRVEPGTLDPSNPLIEGEMPWDSGGVGIHGSVFHDFISGKWRAYLVCTTPEENYEDWSKPWSSEQGRKRRLCLYESADGVNWYRPELTQVPFGDHKTTNILFRLDQGTSAYASILTDPSDHSAPYKMFLLRERSLEGPPPGGDSAYDLYDSADGYNWKLSDTSVQDPMKGDLAFFYHLQPEQYVAYYRLGGQAHPNDHLPPYEDGARRSVFRATSSDGKKWTKDNSMVLTADELDHRDTQYQELVPIRVPGGYLATVTMYHPLSQTQDVRIAASHDGSRWWFPDRRPALGNAPLGDYGGGMIWQSQNLIVQNGRLYMYYGASEGTHRQISDSLAPSKTVAYLQTVINEGGHFLPFNTALCRAYWEYDRLYALISSAGGPTVGTAVTKSQELAGKQLWVNIVTRPAKKSSTPGFDEGYLQVELLDSNDKPLPGYGRQDCILLKGNSHMLSVKWTGGDRAPKQATKAKFYLKRVFLYGFQFKG
jgi:hypothetical protein